MPPLLRWQIIALALWQLDACATSETQSQMWLTKQHLRLSSMSLTVALEAYIRFGWDMRLQTRHVDQQRFGSDRCPHLQCSIISLGLITWVSFYPLTFLPSGEYEPGRGNNDGQRH